MYRKKQVISREKEEIAKNYYAVVSRNLNAQEDHLTGLTKTPDGEKVVETIVTFLKTGEPSFEVLSQKLESNVSDHIQRFVKRLVTEDREAIEAQERKNFLTHRIRTNVEPKHATQATTSSGVQFHETKSRRL